MVKQARARLWKPFAPSSATRQESPPLMLSTPVLVDFHLELMRLLPPSSTWLRKTKAPPDTLTAGA